MLYVLLTVFIIFLAIKWEMASTDAEFFERQYRYQMQETRRLLKAMNEMQSRLDRPWLFEDGEDAV